MLVRKWPLIFILLATILFFVGLIVNKKINNSKEKKTMPIKNQDTITLPQPKTIGQMSVEEAISKRRSRRDFKDQSLSLEQISQILWSAQGITDKEREFRSAPSAGALYPIEIYLVGGEKGVGDLAAGVYHFNADKFVLERLLSGDRRQDLKEAALNQEAVGQAPASLVITAMFERTTQKYGQRGERYVNLEAGHVAQNVYLQVETLGLGTVSIGAFDDNRVKEILSLPKETQPLYIMPIGRV